VTLLVKLCDITLLTVCHEKLYDGSRYQNLLESLLVFCSVMIDV
jgi:hypothetical protein